MNDKQNTVLFLGIGLIIVLFLFSGDLRTLWEAVTTPGKGGKISSAPGQVTLAPDYTKKGSVGSGIITESSMSGGGLQKASPMAAKAYAKAMLNKFGWSPRQFAALNTLWTNESGWRWNAQNPYSTAYGIAQNINPSSYSSAGKNWRTSVTTQIIWGLTYIKNRYGNPANALAAWESRDPHWY